MFSIVNRNMMLIVSPRRRELGVRLALGATPRDSVTSHKTLAIMANIEDADFGEVRRILTGPLPPAGK